MQQLFVSYQADIESRMVSLQSDFQEAILERSARASSLMEGATELDPATGRMLRRILPGTLFGIMYCLSERNKVD